MARTRNILHYMLLVLLASALGLGAYLMSAAGLGRNQLPMPFGVGLATVESNSMQPSFGRGDLLVVGEAAEPAVGDVVVYQDPTIGLVVHRVVALDGDLVTTQGDANNTADVPFDRSLIRDACWRLFPHWACLWPRSKPRRACWSRWRWRYCW